MSEDRVDMTEPLADIFTWFVVGICRRPAVGTLRARSLVRRQAPP